MSLTLSSKILLSGYVLMIFISGREKFHKYISSKHNHILVEAWRRKEPIRKPSRSDKSVVVVVNQSESQSFSITTTVSLDVIQNVIARLFFKLQLMGVAFISIEINGIFRNYSSLSNFPRGCSVKMNFMIRAILMFNHIGMSWKTSS